VAALCISFATLSSSVRLYCSTDDCTYRLTIARATVWPDAPECV